MTAKTIDIEEDRWSIGLIQTKMAPPRPPRGRVGQRNLIERLGAVQERRLSVVVAPAGFGKTTLLAEWYETLRELGHLAAWLSIDEEDDDQQQLGAYFVEALTRGADGKVLRASELLGQDPLTPMKTVLAVLLNEIAACGHKFFLFVDDFELLNSRQCLALVSRLLRYAPSNLHLVIGSRRAPNLALDSMFVQEQVLTLTSEELRFTSDDAQTFFARASGISIDRSGVELLHHATEGWVTGLQLAVLALRERSTDAGLLARDLESNRFGIDAYLDGTVFAQLPPAVLRFVLRVSILDRMCADTCDAVMGAGSRSWEKLDWLERHNVFIQSLDPDHRWFRFHTLMAEALRRRAQKQIGVELQVLHRRASQWFASEGLWPEAVRHALAGGEVERAAKWAEGCASALIDRSDVQTLLGWFAKLPAELVHGSVRLRLAKAWAQTLSFHISDALRSVQALATELEVQSTESSGLHSDAVDATLSAEVAAVRALIAGFADDTPLSLELGEKFDSKPAATPWALRFAHASKIFGLAYSGRFDEVQRFRQTLPALDDKAEPLYASVYLHTMIGLASLVDGRLLEAIDTFEGALARAETVAGRESAAAALPAGYLVALYYERNDLVRARQVLGGRTAIVMEACPLGSLLRYCRGAARLYARDGDVQSALVILEEARELAAERGWLRLRAGCDAETLRLHLQEGRLADAARVVIDLRFLMPVTNPSPMGSFLETWASWCEIKSRLAIVHGRAKEAIDIIDSLCPQLLSAGMHFLHARATILKALALYSSGNTAEAFHALDDSLRYASTEPMVNSFVDEGAPLFELLTKRRKFIPEGDSLPEGVVDRLLAAFTPEVRTSPGTTFPSGPTFPTLSAREVEILNHISRGLSNKEIARALRVAPETIKWHLKNVFEKLNVGSRIEAVQFGLGFARPASAGLSARSDNPNRKVLSIGVKQP